MVTSRRGEQRGRDEILARAGPDPVQPQRRRLRAGHLPGPRRFDRDLSGLRRAGDPDRALGRRGRAHQQDQSAHRRHHRPARAVRHLPRQALRHRAVQDRAGRHRHPGRAGGAAGGAQGRRASCSRRSGSSRAPVRRGDAARGRHLRRHRELLAASERSAGRRAARVPVRLLPARVPGRGRRVARERCPQIGGMFNGDRARKLTLVEYGFRLPSALDNRPLQFDEFMTLVPQMISLSATPGDFELRLSQGVVVEQIIRPTGLVDPEVDIRPVRGQVDDLLNEIRIREARARAGAGHHPHQADVGGSHGLPPAGRRAGALPPLRHRRHRADGDSPRPPAGRLRRAGRHQPAARGARPARGLAGGDPRRRPGGVPPERPVAGPDHRPRGPPHQRAGHHVRRPAHRLDAARARGDDPPPRDPAAPQRRARHHAPLDHQVDGGGAALDPRGRCPHRAARAPARDTGRGSISTIPPGARPPCRRSSGRCGRPRPTSSSSWRPCCATSSTTSRRMAAPDVRRGGAAPPRLRRRA